MKAVNSFHRLIATRFNQRIEMMDVSLQMFRITLHAAFAISPHHLARLRDECTSLKERH